MTQLTVSIEDVSMLDQIRQALSLLRGVTSVSLKRQCLFLRPNGSDQGRARG